LSLREQIENHIREFGPLPFSRYMEICLYDRVAGYYSRNAEQFGKAGDFYTSSDIHAVFGRLLARQFVEMWQTLDSPSQLEILELGPGRGLFARDVLDWSRKKFPDFFAALTYTLQESSPPLRVKLAENLQNHISTGKACLSAGTLSGASPNTRSTICRSGSPDVPMIVFANEFFDALPVEILSSEGKLYIAFESGHLTEIWLSPSPQEIEFLDRYSVRPQPGERLEVPFAAERWIASIANAIKRGFALLVDYGYTRDEQLAGGHRGTLMAYRRHTASANPYEAPGEQDLTAYVNFTALTAAVEQAGMATQGLVTQSQFLMGIGERNRFADAFEDCRVLPEQAKVALQLKHLVTPAGMGENFRVLLASREVKQEKVRLLAGLRFAESAAKGRA
jgi:SAM-dependent MidA family methyltransferase